MTTEAPQADPKAPEKSFAETALALGGKSVDEARRTGAIDTADDQVEALFAAEYQTVNSPAHRAVWDRGVPVELFTSSPPKTPPDVQRVMDDSISVVQRHKQAGTLLNCDLCDRPVTGNNASGGSHVSQGNACVRSKSSPKSVAVNVPIRSSTRSAVRNQRLLRASAEASVTNRTRPGPMVRLS